MQLGDFDLYRKAVTVLGKGEKPRRMPISGELVDTVDEHLLTEYPVIERLPTLTDHLWFPVQKMGDRILTMAPEKDARLLELLGLVDEGRTEAGVRHRKPHMMRHTFATDVLDATEGNLYAVPGLLGHSSTRVTETYLHSSQDAYEAAVEALGEYRKKGSRENLLIEDCVKSLQIALKRRRADSNRCTRLCRPLPNHSATSPGGSHRSPDAGCGFARGRRGAFRAS